MKEVLKNVGLAFLLCLLLGSFYFVFFYDSSDEFDNFSHVSDFPEIEKEGRLVVVTDYSTIGYHVKGDTVEGFNYELLQILQEYTDINIEVVLESSLEKSLEGLASGKYNIIARTIPITSALKGKVFFSQPITQNKQILVQRKPEFNNDIPPVRSHLDLAKKTLHVSKNSPVILRINNLSKEIGDTIFYIEDDVYGSEQLAIMVAQGEIDFAVCDEQTAKKMLASQPELDLGTMIGFTQFEAWAVSKDSPVLLDSLNSWINRAQDTKKYNAIYKRYYH